MMFLPTGQYPSPKFAKTVFILALLGVPAILIGAYAAVGVRANKTDVVFASDGGHSWEFSPRNAREAAHLEAANFLVNLNFYEEGHGLVFPPSLTKSRIENSVGAERFAKMSGLVVDRGKVYGVSEQQMGKTKVLVAGCAACHVGKAAGIAIPGLGNKTADFFGLVQASEESVKSTIAYDAAAHAGDEDWQRANEAGTKTFYRILEHSEYDGGVAGAAPLFFVLESAFEEEGLPPLEKPLFAPVKAPSLWGYGPKREVGVFADALLKGKPAGAAGLPLFIGNYSLEMFQENMETYEAAEQQFERLLPPHYPFAVDRSAVVPGKQIFANNCAQCHGEHNRDQDGLPIFDRPKLIPLADVDTDPVRATVFDDGTDKQFAESPFDPYLRRTGNEPGYIAPKLWGVWARFPYLHNGSVANLEDLLTSPEDRPRYIDLTDIGERYRFDEQRLGATPTNVAEARKRAANQDRWVVDTTRKAFGKGGHDFGTNLSDDEKRELIEYLKTL